jgi:nucleoside-diphosphate-sugar epimerase
VFRGRTFLVTGATGRLGRDLTARLEELGASVLPLVLEGYPPLPKTLPWIARTRPIVVRGADDLAALPAPDHVVHLHWRVDRTRPFAEQVVRELEWNVGRPVFLWDWLRARGSVVSFVNCSSIRVYSHMNPGRITSRTEPRPATPYGVAKLAGEAFFDAYLDKMAVTHLRLCSVCSFGEHPSQLMSRLAAGTFGEERVRVNAGHSVNLLYIDEAVDLIANAALLGRQGRFVIAAPPCPVTEVARTFEQLSGKRLDAEFVDLAPGVPDPEFESDLAAFRADWVRVTSLEEGMRKIIAQHGTEAP